MKKEIEILNENKYEKYNNRYTYEAEKIKYKTNYKTK